MDFEEIIQRLRISFCAKIATQKDLKKYYYFDSNEDYNTYKDIIGKSVYSLDDINDLLLCYSDHLLSNEEILELVLNNKELYYDFEQFGTTFNITNLILYYLLSIKDFDFNLRVLQCIPYDCFFKRSDSIESVVDLHIGESLYDLYILVNDICNISNIEEKKMKVIALMGLIDYSFFSDKFKKIGITFDDIDDFFSLADQKNISLNEKECRRILNNQFSIKHRTLGDEKLYNKVISEYDKYSKLHINFLDEDFISYYNDTFKDDFSSFYINSDGPVLLSVDLFYTIMKSISFRFMVQGSSGIYDIFSKHSSFLSDTNRYKSFIDYWCKLDVKNYHNKERVLKEYSYLLEELKKPIRFTFDYFVLLNVNVEDIVFFKEIVSWICENDYEYFGRNVLKSSVEEQQNTYKDILDNCREKITLDFVNRNAIYKEYYDIVCKFLGKRYISKSSWNNQMKLLEKDYYYRIGYDRMMILLSLVNQVDNIYLKAEEIGLVDDFDLCFDAFKSKHPELENKLVILYDVYTNDKNRVLDLRNLDKKMEEARKCSILLERFLNKDYKSKEAFLEEEGLSETQFDKILNNVMENDYNLYIQFINKFDMLKSQRYAVLMKMVDYVLKALVEGVNDNGIVRPFTFLDYCLLTNLPFDKFTVLVVNSKKLNSINIRQFRSFEKMVKSSRLVTNQEIFNERLIIKIDDIMHEVSLEEKELALRFLRIKGLSNYYSLYKGALNKVLKGEITKEYLDELDGVKHVGKK
ncbi:MAG: hypothetical protein ACI4XM_04550 [Candidatus Coprovivens sp.]